jgi:hypothetical protein
MLLATYIARTIIIALDICYFQESSCQYWPDAVGELAEFGDYTVDLISEEDLEGFTIRTLSVLNKQVL